MPKRHLRRLSLPATAAATDDAEEDGDILTDLAPSDVSRAALDFASKSVRRSARQSRWLQLFSHHRATFCPIWSTDACPDLTLVTSVEKMSDFEPVWANFVLATKQFGSMGIGLYPMEDPAFLTLSTLSGHVLDVDLNSIALEYEGHSRDLSDYLAKPIWRLLDDPAVIKLSTDTAERVLSPV